MAPEGFAAGVDVPEAPEGVRLHDEYVSSGGRLYACPVCVRTRGLQDATWVSTAEVKGAPPVSEFAEEGALTANH